ncbi:hypothetical protein BU17DRAFT_86205 [Hysterangium stoloniferum]|nr:hypothetical protein BU17DRAFT_86205 [Hysterangium stoloniferum]
MDPLSLTASVIAVLQLSYEIVSSAYNFLSADKSIQSNIDNIRTEIRELESLLLALQALLSEQTSLSVPNYDRLRDWKKWLSDCQELLENILLTLTKPLSKWKRLGTRLTWPLKEKDVEKVTELVRSRKQSIGLGLAIDQASTLSALRADTTYVRNQGDESFRSKIIQWLEPLDVDSNYDMAHAKSHKGTGEWFTLGKNFSKWKETTKMGLWLHGIPGCGKTILSSTIVSSLQEQFHSDPSIGLAFHYFSFSDPDKRKVHNMLRTLAAQLLQRLLEIPDFIRDMRTREPKSPSRKTLVNMLEEFGRIFKRTYIVVDALDEVDSTEREKLIEVLTHSPFWDLNILVTSRHERYLEEGFNSTTLFPVSMSTEVVDEDIRRFVSDIVAEDTRLKKWNPTILSEMETTLVEGAHGMFRWVECQLDRLRACRNVNSVRKTLMSLPQTLDETYARMLSEISEDDIELGCNILMWLAFAKRPMTVPEIAEAIIVKSGTSTIDVDERFAEPQDILTICGSLIAVIDGREEYKGYVRLSHYSVKEYLVSERAQSGTPSQFPLVAAQCAIKITDLCITYLSYQDVCHLPSHQGWLMNFDERRDTQARYPFFQYAADAWDYHLLCIDQEALQRHYQEKIFNIFLDNSTTFRKWTTAISRLKFGTYKRNIHGVFRQNTHGEAEYTNHPLYYFALFGLHHAVEIAVKSQADVNALGGKFVTALAAAASEGHYNIVKFLLEHGADPDIQGKFGHGYTLHAGDCCTALQVAILNGHDEIATYLIEKGANVNSRGSEYYGTALRIACKENNEKMVKLLVEKGAEINAAYTPTGSALAAACLVGNLELAKLLLQHGAEVNVRPTDSRQLSAIVCAAYSGNEELVQLLLAHGAEINGLYDCIGRYFVCYCRPLDAVSSKRGEDSYDHVRYRAEGLLTKYGGEASVPPST